MSSFTKETQALPPPPSTPTPQPSISPSPPRIPSNPPPPTLRPPRPTTNPPHPPLHNLIHAIRQIRVALTLRPYQPLLTQQQPRIRPCLLVAHDRRVLVHLAPVLSVTLQLSLRLRLRLRLLLLLLRQQVRVDDAIEHVV